MNLYQNKEKNWFAIEITVPPKASEAIEFAFNELNSLGNEINNLGKKDAENITVIGYFNELPEEELLQSKLDKSLKVYGFSTKEIEKIEKKKIEDQDWLAEWKKYWKPTETDRFIISPPWENNELSDKIEIKIEPNMAFGTGTHETTRLCLGAIEKHYKSEMSFLDVGTGTGILAIAVQKLNAKNQNSKVIACDIDEDSIKIAKENAELNSVEGIEFYVGSISKDSPNFDFVCANVTTDIIIPMLPILVEKFKQLLVLSGILIEQKQMVLNEMKKYKIENPVIEIDGEWVSIVVKNV